MDVEARIAGQMVRRAIWYVPLLAIAVGLARGLKAGLAAMVGAGLVVLTMWSSGKFLSWSARRSPNALGAAALGGFVVRLFFLFAAVWALLAVGLDRTGVLVGVGATYVSLLVMQARTELVGR